MMSHLTYPSTANLSCSFSDMIADCKRAYSGSFCEGVLLPGLQRTKDFMRVFEDLEVNK